MVVVNLERGMPTVQMAMSQLSQSLASARARRTTAIKIIHGYGSSGKGGAIRAAVQRELTARKQNGQIKEFVIGEEFSPFYEKGRRAVDLLPELRRDMDYGRTNQGVTIVIL